MQIRPRATDIWTSPWTDAVAFALGLAAAWYGSWAASDLVWSLWLSSLVVGYAMIVWSIVRGAKGVPTLIRSGRSAFMNPPRRPPPLAVAGGLVALLVISGCTLAFFTVHFGMFHYVHSQFLGMFFPLDGANPPSGTLGAVDYVEVFRRYWVFLPAAFLAERVGFRRISAPAVEPITAMRRGAKGELSGVMIAPYRNVIRMHLLIFFFAAASFASLDNFAVYAVVYAVYFFPWRLVRRGQLAEQPAP